MFIDVTDNWIGAATISGTEMKKKKNQIITNKYSLQNIHKDKKNHFFKELQILFKESNKINHYNKSATDNSNNPNNKEFQIQN